MGRGIRKTRYLSEIKSARELTEARRELELREFFARERLSEDVASTFTLGNLLSAVAPPGSVVDRVIGSVGTGFSTVQAVIGVIGSLLGGKVSRSKPAARTAHRIKTGTAGRKKSTASHTTTRKRTPEIEVEVELEPKRPATPRSKKS